MGCVVGEIEQGEDSSTRCAMANWPVLLLRYPKGILNVWAIHKVSASDYPVKEEGPKLNSVVADSTKLILVEIESTRPIGKGELSMAENSAPASKGNSENSGIASRVFGEKLQGC